MITSKLLIRKKLVKGQNLIKICRHCIDVTGYYCNIKFKVKGKKLYLNMKTKNAATENLVLDALIIILKRPINMDVKNYSGVYTVFRNYI